MLGFYYIFLSILVNAQNSSKCFYIFIWKHRFHDFAMIHLCTYFLMQNSLGCLSQKKNFFPSICSLLEYPSFPFLIICSGKNSTFPMLKVKLLVSCRYGCSISIIYLISLMSNFSLTLVFNSKTWLALFLLVKKKKLLGCP